MNLVIGGGMAGLIWTWFHPEMTIIEKASIEEKQRAWEFPLPQYIYDSPETEKFLLDILGKVPPRRRVSMGIWYKGEFVSPSKEMTQLYWKKTRSSETPAESHAMSSRKQNFIVFDVPLYYLEKELRGILSEQIIEDKVLEIDLEKKEILMEKESTISFENLVITIPQPLFWNLAKGKIVNIEKRKRFFKFRPITILKGRINEDFVWGNSFDYIVYPDPNVPWYRLTKEFEIVGLESTIEWWDGPASYHFTLEGVPSSNGRGTQVIIDKIGRLPYGKIGATRKTPRPIEDNALIFFGRYGEWNGKLKIHDLIKRAEENAKTKEGKMQESLEGVYER